MPVFAVQPGASRFSGGGDQSAERSHARLFVLLHEALQDDLSLLEHFLGNPAAHAHDDATQLFAKDLMLPA